MTSLDRLGLSSRTYQVLLSHGFSTAEQLARMSDFELRRYPALGVGRVKEIREAIAQCNLQSNLQIECGQCKYWWYEGSGDWKHGAPEGQCRINPPYMEGWPRALIHQCCGQAKPKTA